MKEYLQLFSIFFRMGAFTFGGGMAMLPILQREIVEKYHWATEEEIVDYYAIGQCTPGIIAVNLATFIGARRKGTMGGIVATLGMVCPSLIIITLIAACLTNFAELQVVKDAFAGIRVCVCVLIFNAVSKLAKAAVVDRVTEAIFLAVIAVNIVWDISPVYLVVTAGVLGLLVQKARHTI